MSEMNLAKLKKNVALEECKERLLELFKDCEKEISSVFNSLTTFSNSIAFNGYRSDISDYVDCVFEKFELLSSTFDDHKSNLSKIIEETESYLNSYDYFENVSKETKDLIFTVFNFVKTTFKNEMLVITTSFLKKMELYHMRYKKNLENMIIDFGTITDVMNFVNRTITSYEVAFNREHNMLKEEIDYLI